jgi:hypothetical protein
MISTTSFNSVVVPYYCSKTPDTWYENIQRINEEIIIKLGLHSPLFLCLKFPGVCLQYGKMISFGLKKLLENHKNDSSYFQWLKNCLRAKFCFMHDYCSFKHNRFFSKKNQSIRFVFKLDRRSP